MQHNFHKVKLYIQLPVSKLIPRYVIKMMSLLIGLQLTHTRHSPSPNNSSCREYRNEFAKLSSAHPTPTTMLPSAH